jgi:hypothetical protein
MVQSAAQSVVQESDAGYWSFETTPGEHEG